MIRLNCFFQAADAAKYKDALRAAVALTEKSRNHAGCIAYDVFQSATRSDVFMFCETWKDDASLKCQSERIDELKARYDCVGNPYNESPKYWIGLAPHTSPDALTKDLTRNSYEIVKAKYTKKK